jgi:hypothetical protein
MILNLEIWYRMFVAGESRDQLEGRLVELSTTGGARGGRATCAVGE